MTDKELWRQMDMLADETPGLEREMKFMLLPIMPGAKPKPEFYKE
jgi:hypothetical protein